MADETEAWEAEQREINQAQIDNPAPNDFIERRAELRDSGMDPDQIDTQLSRWIPAADQPSEWYRQTQTEHEQDLRAPQRIPAHR